MFPETKTLFMQDNQKIISPTDKGENQSVKTDMMKASHINMHLNKTENLSAQSNDNHESDLTESKSQGKVLVAVISESQHRTDADQ